MKPFQITVPASSGNVGPGFDSMGLAVNLYLSIKVEMSNQWEFVTDSFDSTVPYEQHFIYKIAKQIADKHGKTLPPCKVIENNQIPLARGLGSSASAILVGIELANQLCDLNLSPYDKLCYGTEIEGHPDNIAPALFGGLVISATFDKEIEYIEIRDLDMDIVVNIPKVKLKTKDARSVLPENYPSETAARASGISNLVVAALLRQDYELAGRMMERDLFHEPYRKELIPNYSEIRKAARENGAYGTILSGAGPTMMTFVPSGKGATIAQSMKGLFPNNQVKALNICTKGLQVTYE